MPVAKQKETESWLSHQVLDALKEQYPAGQWTFVEQVPNGTSRHKSRTADAMAMGCWQSSGIDLHGFEVKVSRSDWLREIQDVNKSAAFTKHCHYWWIATPVGIVKLEELPATWGLKEVIRNSDGKTSVKVRRPATFNSAASVDFTFLSAILRVCKTQNKDEDRVNSLISKAREESRQKAAEDWNRNKTSWHRNADRELEELKKNVKDFEDRTGFKLTGFHAGKDLGKSVAAVMKIGNLATWLSHLESSIERITTSAREARTVIESAWPPKKNAEQTSDFDDF